MKKEGTKRKNKTADSRVKDAPPGPACFGMLFRALRELLFRYYPEFTVLITGQVIRRGAYSVIIGISVSLTSFSNNAFYL